MCEKLRAVFAFERRAIEASADLYFGAMMNGLEGVQAFFEGVHIGGAPSAKIERGLRGFGDDIGADTAGDDVGIDGDALTKIIPLFNANNLRG